MEHKQKRIDQLINEYVDNNLVTLIVKHCECCPVGMDIEGLEEGKVVALSLMNEQFLEKLIHAKGFYLRPIMSKPKEGVRYCELFESDSPIKPESCLELWRN